MSRATKSFTTLSDGFRIAYQQWQSSSSSSGGGGGALAGVGEAGRRCLCLHGWMDNSNSFSVVGPYLAERGYTVVALDQQGHGHSSHGSNCQLNQFPKYLYHVKEMLAKLEWDTVTLIGHSMGGGISTMFAGVYPEAVDKLVLIEGFGPVSKEPSAAATTMRRALDGESKFHLKEWSITGGPLYSTVFEATKARMTTVKRFPGNQYISEEGALSLIRRGTFPGDVTDEADPRFLHDPSDTESVRFRHDPKLNLPSYSYNTPEQVLSFINGIVAPTLYISGEDGFPYAAEEELLLRKKVLSDKNLLQEFHSPGSHHLHLDPTQAYGVAEKIFTFIEN